MAAGDGGIDVIIVPPKKVVSVKLDADLIAEIDRLWRKHGYQSRSDFIREAILCYIQLLSSREARGAGETRGEEEVGEGDEDVRELLELVAG